MLSNWIDNYVNTHLWAYWAQIIFLAALGIYFLFTWYEEFSYDLKNGKSVKDSFFNRGNIVPLFFIGFYGVYTVLQWVNTAFWDFLVKVI